MSNTIPTRLLQSGRPVIPKFAPDELLFMRVQREHVHGDEVDNMAIRFPDFSVNRGEFSEPEDVLLPCYIGMGVCQFNVQDIPPGPHVPDGSSREYTFNVFHVPEEENYAHSEVRAHKDGVHSPKLDLPKSLKKLFRNALRQKMRVVIHPA